MLIRESFSNGKKSGEVGDEGGLGNSDFNQCLKEAKFAFEILHLYNLKIRIPLYLHLSSKKSITYFHHSDTHICQVHLRILLYGANRKYFKFCWEMELWECAVRS